MNLILPNIKEVEEDPKKVELENLIVGYINRIIKFDIELGRTKENFFIEDYNNITKNIKQFKADGFRVFIGGGNLFFLKIEKKLTGWQAACVHARGMARRKISIKEIMKC